MSRDRQTIGTCPQCAAGSLRCSYNFFEKAGDSLVIHTWEHRCLDCGFRETQGFRNDEGELPQKPDECPFCGRAAQK